MEYVVREFFHPADEDEPNFVYSQLDEDRRETRRVEFYPNGICFAYGGEMGHEEALNPEPFPENFQEWNRSGETETRSIPRHLFLEVWEQALERPDGFMGMLI